MESDPPRTTPGEIVIAPPDLPTRADLAQALRAQTSTKALLRFPLIIGTATIVTALVLLLVAESEHALFVAVMGTNGMLGGLVGRWVDRKWRVWKITKHLRAHGKCTTRLDDDGVHTATDLSEVRLPWTSFRHYVETTDLFVLLTHGKTRGMVLLPKRGLPAGTDIDDVHAYLIPRIAPLTPNN